MIQTLPPVLVLTLKMFDDDGVVVVRKKKLPMKLNMDNYILRTTNMMLESLPKEDCQYELYAVVSCHGPSLQECEYITTVKTLHIEKKELYWVEYSRGKRKTVHHLKVLRDQIPQIVFYKRVPKKLKL